MHAARDPGARCSARTAWSAAAQALQCGLTPTRHPSPFADVSGRASTRLSSSTTPGHLSWRQRAWAAVLLAAPAALFGESALRAFDGPGRRGHDDAGPIHVAVVRARAVPGTPPGVVAAPGSPTSTPRPSGTSAPPQTPDRGGRRSTSQPARATTFGAVGHSRGRRAVPSHHSRSASRDGARVRDGGSPVGRSGVTCSRTSRTGACSALEHAYLTACRACAWASREPCGRCGHPPAGRIYRDVVYVALGLVVELDGRLVHSRLARIATSTWSAISMPLSTT